MVVTQAALKALIVTEVNDVNGVVAANIDTIWEQASRYRAIPGMQFLQAKKEALGTVIMALRSSGINKRVRDLQIDKDGQLTSAEGMLKEVCDQIRDLAKQWQQSKASTVVDTANTQITPPPAFQPPDPYAGMIDANSPAYRGDVYRRRW